MQSEFHLHDPVALLADIPARDFETSRPLRLKRGQIGTIVMIYNSETYEVEFTDIQGQTCALLPIPAAKLMRLHHMVEAAA
ncbi:hypothetical protein Thiowin_00346 [Thiorhodovibrio winogradskyi]|uniref:DUF4926 domain-containing protein n=1 Tax=Thiorhodovibrio winogradskyi TaxID=77007 RepID=A0ABZ0S4H6_9GAMM|nr:DUF4926 domain-containing protein [Thiorhodovibrio winogradskyi]